MAIDGNMNMQDVDTNRIKRSLTDWCEYPYKVLSDPRLKNVRHVESNFPLRRFSSREEWEAFRESARQKMRISIGLFPEPEPCPLLPKRFEKKELGGFVTEKILLQSMPGFYLTGCIYWPAGVFSEKEGAKKKVPMILNPHGHWDEGRFEMSQITSIPQRCANFALRGMAAFSFDMIGFGDSRQLPHEGYAGYEHDLWNESLLGLQVYNCLRALDFVCSLEEVDTERIGSTGASGGGTQTIWLTALDDRIRVSMPVNMVSTLFQGSCICEYAPSLHIGLSNLEIAAMAAPRPMLLAGSSGDWTEDLPDVVFPWLQDIYRLYEKKEKKGKQEKEGRNSKETLAYFFRKGPHGYEKAAQEEAYRWFYKQFFQRDLSPKEAAEREFLAEEREQLLAAARFYEGDSCEIHIPALTYEELFETRKAEKRRSLQNLFQNREGMQSLQKALGFAVGAPVPSFRLLEQKDSLEEGLLYRKELLKSQEGAEIPMLSLSLLSGTPEGAKENTAQAAAGQNKKALFFAYEGGKRALFSRLKREGFLGKLLKAGYTVICADLFLTGEHQRPFGISGRDFSMPESFRCVNHYVTAYNYTDAAYRVRDYIGVFQYLRPLYEELIPAGMGKAAAWAAAALPFLPKVSAACLREEDLPEEEELVEDFFLPGFLNGGGFKACRLLSNIPWLSLEQLIEEL